MIFEKKPHILLIEDNPGDVRLIEEMVRDSEHLLQLVDVDKSDTSHLQLHHERDLSAGLEHLEINEIDLVLLDLNLPDSNGIDTLNSVSEATEMLPIVVLTGLDDRQLGIDSIKQGAQDYLVKDEVTGDTLLWTVHRALERNRMQRNEIRRREQLKILHDLNKIAHDIIHIVITNSTREDIEHEICDRLAASDAYRFAWIGEVQRGSNQVKPRVAAGVDESYLESILLTVDDTETGRGPTGKAVQTREVQVVQNIQTNPEYEPWREQAEKYGYRASIAIPITYEGVLYGVLNIYSGTKNVFSEPEQEIFTRLGDSIGHAISAIERKKALVSDVALELEFQVDGIFEDLVAFTSVQSGEIRFENVLEFDNAVYGYGIASGFSEAEFREIVDETDSVYDYRYLTTNSEATEFNFEIALAAVRPLFKAATVHGGQIQGLTISDKEIRVIMEFPGGNDTHEMVELVQDHIPSVTLVSKRTRQRSADHGVPEPLLENLTEKQREAIEKAYTAGYFNWPRTTNAGEIAERLGVSSATFTQHLRTAERKIFDCMFEEQSTDESDTNRVAPSNE